MPMHEEVKKLIKNITKYSNLDVAHEIALGKDLPLNPTVNEKNAWVDYITSELDKRFDERTIKDIRMGCYCGENGKLEESKVFIKRIYDDSKTMTEFVDKLIEGE